MRLHSFRIQNFKSIQDTGDVKVSLDDNITILAGQNESGKSSILEALDFFENGAKEDFEDTYRRLNSSPRIECSFFLSDDELDKFEIASGNKAAKEYVKKQGVTLVRGSIKEDDYSTIKYVLPEELKKLLESKTASSAEDDADEEAENDEFNFGGHIMALRPRFIFYSSFDGNILPNKITKAELGSNQAVKDFEDVFGTDFNLLLSDTSDASRKQKLNEINSKASDNLNEYWSQKVDDEKSDYKFSVELFPQQAAPETSYVNFLIDQGDNYPLHFAQKSKGFQWFSSFNLRLRAHEASSDNLSGFILLIDEPGHNLHEEAQKNVKRVLNELANNGVQIIFSTHQAQLLKSSEEVDLSRIKLIARSKSTGTKIQNIAQASSQNGFKDALAPIRTAMGLVTIDVSSFTNGSRIVIVEGITDSYYISGFMKISGNTTSVSVIPCAGVSQSPNVFSILLGWGVNDPKVIVDDDSAGTKEYNRIKKNLLSNSSDESKRLLYKNSGCKGIEDTFDKDDFMKFASDFLDSDKKANLNSDLAKGKKELIARTFLDRVNDPNNSLKMSDFNQITQTRIESIVDFITK